MTTTSSDSEIAARLVGLSAPGGDPAAEVRLRARLATEAESEGLLDVAYRTVDSPIGSLLLAATPNGLVRVAFDVEGHETVLVDLADAISPRVVAAPRRLDAVAAQLDEYFSGDRRAFDIPVDLQLVHGFRRTVIEHLPDIAYGTTESYGWLAGAAGNPKAVRAVGSACANNPVPVVVPCHRVVRHDGTIGQYLGGTEAKRTLIELEAA
jgi:methylated-DNA-[protein]-cysteine S-methyltransferase